MSLGDGPLREPGQELEDRWLQKVREAEDRAGGRDRGSEREGGRGVREGEQSLVTETRLGRRGGERSQERVRLAGRPRAAWEETDLGTSAASVVSPLTFRGDLL